MGELVKQEGGKSGGGGVRIMNLGDKNVYHSRFTLKRYGVSRFPIRKYGQSVTIFSQ